MNIFNDLLKIKTDIKDDIQLNILNIFSQRCKCNLNDYFNLISNNNQSKYIYYGIVDSSYIVIENIDLFQRHLDIAIKLFETRIKNLSFEIHYSDIITIHIEYMTFLNFADKLEIKMNNK